MPIILKNNVDSTLAQAISSSETAAIVTAGDGAKFPALGAGDYFYATLVSAQGTREIVKVTSKSIDTLAITRAQEGTTANGFAVGSRVEMRVTAASITDLVDEHDQASEITIADAGGYYTSGTVEGALQEAAQASTTKYTQGGTGAVTRTVQGRLQDYVSVKDFGAVGDGVTDDTAAFNLAISYANAKGGNDRGGITGSTIFIPEGRYVISAALNPITVSSVCFVGASRASAVILSLSTTSIFTFGDASLSRTVVGGGVSDVKIEYPAGPSGGAIAFVVDYGFSLTFENLMLENIGTLLSLGQSASRIAGGVIVRNVQGSIGNIGVPMFNMKYGAGLFITDCQVFVRGVLVPIHPAPMTTVPGTIVFRCDTGFWDTCQLSNCLFERFDIGVSVTASTSMVYQNFIFSNVIFDYFRRWAVYLEEAGGAIATFVFDSTCWFVSWEEDAIAIIGSGNFNDGHKISGTIPIAGKYGVKYQVANAKNNSITNLVVNGCNRLGTVAACLQFQGNSTGFTVNSVSGNDDAVIAWTRPSYGIVVTADCDNFIVTSCRLQGPIAGYSFAVNASGSSSRKAYNNVNANYSGYAPKSMPASGVSYRNTSPFIEEWSFFGGTITSGYDKNGQGFPGALQYLTFRLEPNDTFACGYSIAPTVRVFVEK